MHGTTASTAGKAGLSADWRQPEDNLDNHFIDETVVSAVRRMRNRRQMILVTHNANIPVLGEADLVVVMADLREVFRRLGSMVEAADVEPTDFEVRRVELVEWPKIMNGRYAAQSSQIDVRFECDVDQSLVIDASDYLLETIF